MLDDLSLNIMGIVKLGIPAWESTFAQYLIIEKKKNDLLHEYFLFGAD